MLKKCGVSSVRKSSPERKQRRYYSGVSGNIRKKTWWGFIFISFILNKNHAVQSGGGGVFFLLFCCWCFVCILPPPEQPLSPSQSVYLLATKTWIKKWHTRLSSREEKRAKSSRSRPTHTEKQAQGVYYVCLALSRSLYSETRTIRVGDIQIFQTYKSIVYREFIFSTNLCTTIQKRIVIEETTWKAGQFDSTLWSRTV